MTVPLWVLESASTFWAAVGEEEPFPRNLRRAIANALPVAVVLLPKLHAATISRWLQTRSIACPIRYCDRPLRACLVARFGHGLIFLDGTDPEDEQRFSLAHEIAHFLLHYWQPRRRVEKQLGPDALAVLDGNRPPHLDERVHALLSGVSIGFYVHLMDRDFDGEAGSGGIAKAESDADRLAFELLAPAEAVLNQVSHYPHDSRREVLKLLLRDHYRIPENAATRYASLLLPSQVGSFVRRLGIVY